jgi:hypothetical protein
MMNRLLPPMRSFRPVFPAALLLACALATLLPAGTVRAEEVPPPDAPREIDRWGDQVSVFSGSIHVPENMRLRGSVVCIGGSALIEGRVTGDVVVILGGLEITGSVEGAVTGVLSDMELRDAEVSRELVSVLSGLQLERSTVRRELVNILGPLDRDELTELKDQLVNIGFGGKWFPSVASLLFWLRLFHKFMVFVLLLVIVLLVPERIRLMGEEAPIRYVPAFFVGLLGYLAMLVIVGLLTVTFIGIFPALFAFYVLKWMGIAAIFFAVGRRLGRAVGASLSVLGSVLLVFALYVVLMLAPTPLGWMGLAAVAVLKLIFFLAFEVPAVGLVILTRLGTHRSGAEVVAPPAPPEAGTSPTPEAPA